MLNALNLFAPKALEVNLKIADFTSETLEMLWQTPLLGMGMVFSVLAILWGVLILFKFIFARPAPKKTESASSSVAEVISEPTEQDQSDDGELIAILTAAIVAYEADCGNEVAPSGFRVVSFRRANGGKAWNSK